MRKNNAWLALAVGLLGVAITQELRKPPGKRTWTGKVAGFVPYDLRPPTLQRILATFWSPDKPKILVPQAFGVGWTVNLGRVVRLVLGRQA